MSLKSLIRTLALWQVGIFVVVTLSSVLPLRFLYIGGLTQTTATNPQPYIRNPFLYFRGNFDGIHYVDIARKGYGYGQQAFFPLYPTLLKRLNFLHNLPLTGAIISVISFIVGLYFLKQLLSLDYSQVVVKWTILALLIFPVSFYFSAVYTEGLFFALSASAFYAVRRHKWLLAGLLAALATYTRLVGVFLLPALLYEMWLHKDQHTHSFWDLVRKIFPLLLVPGALLLYMSFLNRNVGDPWAFVHTQDLFGQGRSEKIILLYQVFWRYIKMIFTVNTADPLYLTILLEFLTAIIFFVTSIILALRHRASYFIYSLCSYILPTLSGTFTSLPRYILVSFPTFIVLGSFLAKAKPRVRTIYIVVSLILFVIYTSLFARGYWVA